jgi:hypothetical protein
MGTYENNTGAKVLVYCRTIIRSDYSERHPPSHSMLEQLDAGAFLDLLTPEYLSSLS